MAIRVEELGKLYRIGVRGQSGFRYKALRDVLTDTVSAPFRALGSRIRGGVAPAVSSSNTIWALRDISFEIQHGDVVGIIGRNGAGKSTLLKLLSRITEPTEGSAEIRGRIGSLLEVGTGFHPELTGRENVYLNGAILGMHRAEIDRKFDEIVSFAEVEQFIDTPVKHYSSGMYLRLAFAVAAHLEPEILIVDEVLAVGDATFQNKCLGKMGDVARQGRTVLLVSHNMTAIGSLCNTVVLLDRGRLTYKGDVFTGISRHISTGVQGSSVDVSEIESRSGPGEFGRITRLSLFDAQGHPQDTFPMGQAMVIRMELSCTKTIPSPEIGVAVRNQLGAVIHRFVSTWEGLSGRIGQGYHVVEITIPQVVTYPGRFSLTIWMKQQGTGVDDQVDDVLMFDVIGADVTGHQPYFERYTTSHCEVYVPSSWRWM